MTEVVVPGVVFVETICLVTGFHFTAVSLLQIAGEELGFVEINFPVREFRLTQIPSIAEELSTLRAKARSRKVASCR